MACAVVVAAAAVADGEVEEVVRAEGETAAAVIGLRFVEFEEDPFGGWVGEVGVGGGDAEFGDDGAAVDWVVGGAGGIGGRFHVEDIEPAEAWGGGVGVGGVEGEAEETAFVVVRGFGDQFGADVEEGDGEEHAIAEDADGAALFDDERAAGAIAGVGHCERGEELEVGDEFELEWGEGGGGGCGEGEGGGEGGAERREEVR